MNEEKLSYIKSLVQPNARKPQGRKLWSIDLETVLLPFFIATNASGVTDIANDSIGAPIRLGYDKDGSVKFNKNGRPVTTVVKEIRDNVTLLRENFVAGLMNFTAEVQKDKPAEVKAVIELARKAGDPIIQRDRLNLSSAIVERMAESVEAVESAAAPEATATTAETEKVDATAEPSPELVAV